MAGVQRGARRGGSDDSAIRIDSPELYKLTKDLQAVDKKLAREMKKQFRAVAEPVRARVAQEASWSRRIPKATKVSTRFTARTQRVLITVNRKLAPHARPLENDGKEGTFRHPIPISTASLRRGVVRKTATQQSRPFFAKAIKSQDHRIDAAVEQVAKDFERRLGFK